jgi:hypothetical protein
MNRVDAQFALGRLARQPADTARRYAQGDPVIREALDNGKVLCEHGLPAIGTYCPTGRCPSLGAVVANLSGAALVGRRDIGDAHGRE